MPGKLSYAAMLPKDTFRWIKKTGEDAWKLEDPPAEWPGLDLHYLQQERDLTDAEREMCRQSSEFIKQYYLAIDWVSYLEENNNNQNFNIIDAEEDLYMDFVTTVPNPKNVMNMANKYGLLGPASRQEYACINSTNNPEFAEAFSNYYERFPNYDKRELMLIIESAVVWINNCLIARNNVESWKSMENDAASAEEKNKFIDDGLNYIMSGSLTFQAGVDRKTGQGFTEIHVSCLSSLIDIQWALAAVGGTKHLQCETCHRWMAISQKGGGFRKRFCSEACRIKAHRRRKKHEQDRPGVG